MPSTLPKSFLPFPSGGVRADLPQQALGPSEAIALRNMIPRDNGAVPVAVVSLRSAALSGGDTRIMGLANYLAADGDYRLVWGTDKGWLAATFDAGGFDNPVDISGTALDGSQGDQVVFRVFNQDTSAYLVGTNGHDTPKAWDGDTDDTYVEITDAPKARAMMVMFDRIVLGNLKSGSLVHPAAIDQCASQDMNTGWGQYRTILGDTPGEIVALQEAGNFRGFAYKTDAIYSIEAQPTAAPFAAQPMRLYCTGPASTLSVVSLATGYHMYLGRDGGLYLWDGSNLYDDQFIAAHRYIARTMDPALLDRACAWYDPEYDEFWCAYAGLGSGKNTQVVMVKPRTGEVFPCDDKFWDIRCGIKAWIPLSVTIGELTMPIGDISKTLAELTALSRRTLVGMGTNLASQNAGCYLGSFIDGEKDPDLAAPNWGFITGLSNLGVMERKTVTLSEHYLNLRGPATSDDKLDVTLLVSENGEQVDSVLPRSQGDGQLLLPTPGQRYEVGHRDTGLLFALRIVGSGYVIDWQGAALAVAGRGLR